MTYQETKYPTGTRVTFTVKGATDNDRVPVTGVVESGAGPWRRIRIDGQGRPVVRHTGEIRPEEDK